MVGAVVYGVWVGGVWEWVWVLQYGYGIWVWVWVGGESTDRCRSGTVYRQVQVGSVWLWVGGVWVQVGSVWVCGAWVGSVWVCGVWVGSLWMGLWMGMGE